MNTIDTPVFKTLSRSNIDDEHICCAFSDKKCKEGYLGKKEWLKTQFDQGYVFRKLDVRGKVFIEYVPAQNGWVPLEADGYMLINCFWVSGRYKGQGYAKQLLASCEKDAQKMKGIVVVTGKGKKPFMSDPRFFKKQGFVKVDEAPPYFELWCKKWDAQSEDPKFKDITRNARCDIEKGLAVYYTPACPFNQYYVEHELKEIARKKDIPLAIHPIITKSQAQNHFVPHTLYSVFYKGEFVTQHILNEKQFDKYIQ